MTRGVGGRSREAAISSAAVCIGVHIVASIQLTPKVVTERLFVLTRQLDVTRTSSISDGSPSLIAVIVRLPVRPRRHVDG